MEKDALIERLVRLGATDVPNTPRLLMRKRSPDELAGLQHGVENAFGKLQGPAQAAVDRAADKTFTPRIAGALKSVASVGIKNPEIIPMQGVPIPGLTPAYLAGKRGLEKLIDKVAPIAKHAFTTSQYSYPLNPSIPSQASSAPGFLAPNLQSVVQKRKQAAGAPTRGNFMMASDIPSFAAPDLQSPIQKRSDLDLAFDPAPVAKKSKEKDGDMLPDYVTYNQSDFKKSKYSMPVEEMAKFVATLREKMGAAGGIMGVSPTLGGAPSAAKSVGAPKLSGPGPSIAQIAKPKGPHFGSGIAGAFKGSIGGRAPQDLT